MSRTTLLTSTLRRQEGFRRHAPRVQRVLCEEPGVRAARNDDGRDAAPTGGDRDVVADESVAAVEDDWPDHVIADQSILKRRIPAIIGLVCRPGSCRIASASSAASGPFARWPLASATRGGGA